MVDKLDGATANVDDDDDGEAKTAAAAGVDAVTADGGGGCGVCADAAEVILSFGNLWFCTAIVLQNFKMFKPYYGNSYQTTTGNQTTAAANNNNNLKSFPVSVNVWASVVDDVL